MKLQAGKVKFLSKAEQSAIIAEQTKEFLARCPGGIKHYEQGDSGVTKNTPFLFTNPKKQAKGETGLRSY